MTRKLNICNRFCLSFELHVCNPFISCCTSNASPDTYCVCWLIARRVAPPKYAKRTTFSHKMGQKWGFCRRVKGVTGWGSKSPLFRSKRSFFGRSCTPSPKSILAMGGGVCVCVGGVGMGAGVCVCVWYTAIFLTNGLCIVYCSLPQYRTLVYPGWGQKCEFFCLVVITHRLRSGTVVGYRVLRQPTVGTWQPRAIEVHQGKGQSKVPCHCLAGGHIQDHWGVFTVVPGSEGLRVVPHLPCTRQPVSFRST